jgi:CRP/FNR family transcriptional regulator, cyclic AMP receptor protein
VSSIGELETQSRGEHPGGAARRSVRARPLGHVRLFDEDAGLRGLLAELPPADVRAAKLVRTPAWGLSRGSWDPEQNPSLDGSGADFLLLDGVLLSRVKVGPRYSTELLGTGDLFRAERLDTHGYATVPSERAWRVVLPVRMAVLEPELVLRIAAVPGAASELQHRWAERVRSLALRLAIAQVPNLTTRVHLVLWHIADRWGRRCRDRAVIPFQLTQQVLAECASAQRSSVAVALHKLRERGIVERNEEGHWTLHAAPPTEFA